MRRVFSLVAVLHLAIPASLAEEAKPNTLTPKEIADGWLLLFDGETTFGWKIDGDVKIEQGVMELGGTQDTTATLTIPFGYANLGFEAFTDDAKDAQLTFNAYKGPFIHVAPPREKGWHQFGAQVTTDDISVWARGSKGFGVIDITQPRTHIAFHVPAGQKLLLRRIVCRARDFTPIFNGKDLTGWKEFPGQKSKFTVEDGELHIKNGKGDLQTEALYDDFVLQLDCKTNGKHLNSGVFFRCIPDKYQQGYEAQIHNDFTLDPPKEYAVQEYDPETHQVIGKKIIKSASKDFGTGAIYRRIPARKQVAKDNEWFTMTIVAEGRHFAVWVNGIQVTNWTDNRPLQENPRNGCRLEKGAISLQGHDPTTDLSFRNIRIASLPKKP